jgi:hypothetical protein
MTGPVSPPSSQSGIANAGAVADELAGLISSATNEDLSDGGRYFSDSFTDLAQCHHGDTGEYGNRADGDLIEFLWNNRLLLLHALYAASATKGDPNV